MTDNENFQPPVLEIPGLKWKKLTLKQARQQKCFMQQEFMRWTDETNYLFNMRMTHLTPAPVSNWQENNPGENVGYFIQNPLRSSCIK